MLKVEIPNEFGAVNLEKLNDIENEFGNLPSEFRSSLIATNGGRSILSCFKGVDGDLIMSIIFTDSDKKNIGLILIQFFHL